MLAEQLSSLEVEADTSRNRFIRLEEELAEQSEGHAEAANALADFQRRNEATQKHQEELATFVDVSPSGLGTLRQGWASSPPAVEAALP